MIPSKASWFLNQAPTVYYKNAFYIFGGYTDALVEMTLVARFSIVTSEWNRVGDLVWSRNGHNVIEVQGSFIVIGGLFKRKTEKCDYDEIKKEMQCEQVRLGLELDSYGDYPELFAVEKNYCL